MFVASHVVKILLMNYSCHKRLLSVISLELFQACIYLMLYKNAKQYCNKLGMLKLMELSTDSNEAGMAEIYAKVESLSRFSYVESN